MVGLLNIVTRASIKPRIPAGSARAGIFQPTAAPAKHRAKRIPVLLTAPSKVIISEDSITDDVVLKPLAVFISLLD